MRKQDNQFRHIDWVLVLLFLAMVILGWLNIYAAVYNEAHDSIFDTSQKYGKQMLWIGATFVIGLVVMLFDGRFFEKLAWPIYIITLVLLVAVLIFGVEINGARSWFQFGSVSIQPAEFAKFATCLALAKFLSSRGSDLSKFKTRMLALGVIFLPAIVILPQPDLGSAIVYAALILVLYREGLPGIYIFIGITLSVLFVLSLLIAPLSLILAIVGIGFLIGFIVRKRKSAILTVGLVTVLCAGYVGTVDYIFNNILEDRHRNRINIILGKEHDPQGVGYNLHQSMIAIGSGGVSGKGYMQGTQTKFDFVPEQSTDFIFCTVGEEWGFVGTTAVILLFLVFLFRLVFIAERQKSPFSRIYGYGVLSIFFFHFAINIAMTIGLMPVIGIPLPFFSYGGSSLWGFSLLLFVLIKLDAYRWEIL